MPPTMSNHFQLPPSAESPSQPCGPLPYALDLAAKVWQAAKDMDPYQDSSTAATFWRKQGSTSSANH